MGPEHIRVVQDYGFYGSTFSPRTNSSHMDRDALPAGYYIGGKLQAGALDFLCVCVK